MAVKLWLLGAAFAGAALGTGWVRRYALRRRMIDRPGARRSHLQPTPRGGGIAIVAAFAIGIGGLYGYGQIPASVFGVFCASGSLVVLVSVWDDHQPLPMALRLSLHAAAALWAVYWFDGLQPAGRDLEFANWPAVLVPLCQALALLWLINLYNFMDGIDGLAGSEAVFVALAGVLLLGDDGIGLCLGLLAASCAGFLLWNWPPARIFMGDSGSCFLGLAFGIVALAALTERALPLWCWIILLGVFVVDATVTLLRRILARRRWYEAHRCHAYQHAALRLGSHGKVTLSVLLVDIIWLLPCAYLAAAWPPWAFPLTLLALAPLLVLALCLGAGRERALLS